MVLLLARSNACPSHQTNSIIAAGHCCTPNLELGDFDIEPAATEVASLLDNCGLLRDLDQQRRLAEVCVAQLKLCHHLLDVLKARYTTVAPGLECTQLIALVLVLKPPQNRYSRCLKPCSEARSIGSWHPRPPEVY